MGNLSGKFAIVTGAGRGIGKAIAERFLQDGVAGVAMIDYQEDLVVQAANELDGTRCLPIVCDVSNPDQVKMSVEKVLEKFGTIDILVNNAGVIRDKMLHKMDTQTWDAVIAINLNGPFYFCKEVVAHMRERNYGKIVNISSTSAYGNVGQANYAASKAGIIGMTKSIAKECASKGITANCIAPGGIDTDMFNSIPEETLNKFIDNIPMKRMGSSGEVASVVSFFASDDSSFVTGECITVSGGMLK